MDDIPEGEVDPLLLDGGVLGNAVEPVLLHRALHQQQGTREQGEPDEVRSTLEISLVLVPAFSIVHSHLPAIKSDLNQQQPRKNGNRIK